MALRRAILMKADPVVSVHGSAVAHAHAEKTPVSKNSKKTHRRTTSAIRSIFADLNRPLSPKLADKDPLTM